MTRFGGASDDASGGSPDRVPDGASTGGGAVAAGSIRLGSTAGRGVLATTILGSSMAFLDGTVVNIALPAMGKDLHTGLIGLQWTVTAYTLTLAAFVLTGGSLGDRYGRRRVFLTGVIWFALASLACGLAPNMAS